MRVDVWVISWLLPVKTFSLNIIYLLFFLVRDEDATVRSTRNSHIKNSSNTKHSAFFDSSANYPEALY